jgi:hypothetical protein
VMQLAASAAALRAVVRTTTNTPQHTPHSVLRPPWNLNTTDVKDILGVPHRPPGSGAAAGGGPDSAAPGAKAKPERLKRPEGMSREAFALLGGHNPVIPTHLLGGCVLVMMAVGWCCSCRTVCAAPRQGPQSLGTSN